MRFSHSSRATITSDGTSTFEATYMYYRVTLKYEQRSAWLQYMLRVRSKKILRQFATNLSMQRTSSPFVGHSWLFLFFVVNFRIVPMNGSCRSPYTLFVGGPTELYK